MRLVFLVLLALPGVALPPPKAVHATLVSSEPAANSRLTSSPSRVRLVYSEPVEGKLAKVSIVPSSGAPILLRAAIIPADAHRTVTLIPAARVGTRHPKWPPI